MTSSLMVGIPLLRARLRGWPGTEPAPSGARLSVLFALDSSIVGVAARIGPRNATVRALVRLAAVPAGE